MMRASALWLLWLAVLPRPGRACDCQTSHSACNEVGASDVVFIGTVESIDPISLNLWNLKSPASLRALNDVYAEAQQNPSAAALARLKDKYVKTFPDLAAVSKREMQDAKTISEISSVFYSALYQGMRVRFKVKTLFKHGGDDDDSPKDPKASAAAKPKAKDDDDSPKAAKGATASDRKGKDDDDRGDIEFLDVYTPFGDCGFSFQAGETYLVYANDDDESSNILATGSCTRTRRLSDAGEDLAYLFFYKDHPEESTRLEGFTTTDELYQKRLDLMRDPETMQSPVAGVIVQLQSDRLTRYAESDSKGRFVFDGLAEGDYKLSAFPHEYPLNPQLLAGPRPFHLAPKSCAREILLLPKKDVNVR